VGGPRVALLDYQTRAGQCSDFGGSAASGPCVFVRRRPRGITNRADAYRRRAGRRRDEPQREHGGDGAKFGYQMIWLPPILDILVLARPKGDVIYVSHKPAYMKSTKL